ncbi:MAG TPA: transcriptional regulator, partial [Terriglobales bacterium]|nr:transcriptional regulator [Terriglobales bacterium]
MIRPMFRHTLFVVALALCVSTFTWAGQWTPLGPEGGDVRSLSYDPHNPDRMFLGTSSGQLFVSQDGGASWSRFAHLGAGDDYVLDHVIVDPRDSTTLFVSAWSVEDQHQAGDLFITHDGGRTWQTVPALHGKSLRAMSQSVSNPNILV